MAQHYPRLLIAAGFSLSLIQAVYAKEPATDATEYSPHVSSGPSTGIIEDSIEVPEVTSTPADVRKKLPRQNSSYPVSSVKKLGNGVADVATSWLQIPKTVSQTSRESGILIGLTGGVVKGVVNTVKQAVTGAVEIMTFPIPDAETTAKTEVKPRDRRTKLSEPARPIADEFDMESAFGKAFSAKPMPENIGQKPRQ